MSDQVEAQTEVPMQPQRPVQQERRTLVDLLPLIFALSVFALLGGGTRALVKWNPTEPWQRRLGGGLASLLAGLVVGLPLAEYAWFQQRLGALVATGAIAGYAGVELIDILTRRLERFAEKHLYPPQG